MNTTTKKCPMCAEEIPLAAVTCEYCEAQFEVMAAGYCQNCHEVRPADGAGQCKVCGGTLIDLRVESRFIEEPVQAPIPAPPSTASPTPGKPGRRISPYGIPAGVLIIIVGGALLWLGWNKLRAAPGLLETGTATAAAAVNTLTASTPPAKAPTFTPRPTLTATPLPAWITEFAEPVLAAIANQPPNFQDDFSQESVSWRFNNDINDNRSQIKIQDGALVMTIGPGGEDTGVHFCGEHPAMRFINFALRVEADASRLGRGDAVEINWREADSSQGLIFPLWQDGHWEVVASEPPAHKLASGQRAIKSTDKVTLTLISKGTQYAIYVDETLVTYVEVEDEGRRPGVGIKLCTWDELGGSTTVKFDNLKVWDLDKVKNLP